MDIYEYFVNKDEKALKEIFENSLPGTLAYAESKFYLLLLLKQKILETKDLDESQLEEIAGGAGLKNKTLASLAAALSLLSSSQAALAKAGTPTEQSGSTSVAQNSAPEEYEVTIDISDLFSQLIMRGYKKFDDFPEAKYVSGLSEGQLNG